MAWFTTSPRTRSVLFDVMVSLGVFGLGGFALFRPAIFPIVPVMAVALVWRRSRPLVVMAVVATAALVQVIITGRPYNDPLPFDVAVLVAMYSVVKYGRRMRDAYVAAIVVAVGIAVEVRRHSDIRWPFQVLFYLAVCGGVWLGGYVVRTRRAYVTGLEERAATLEREREHLAEIAVAHERAAIAREMHDVVAHSLAVIIVQADGGRYAMAHDPQRGRAVLETVATTARDALEEMGRLIELLRAGRDDDGEADPDRRVWGIDRLDALVAGAHAAGVDTTLTVAEVPVADNSTLSVAVYRLVQEALTNVLRHAGPRARCAVSVDCESGSVRVSVVDDGGTGPKPAGTPGRVGHGLVGMRERVAVLGGTLTVGPRAGGGWSVHANLPIPEHAAAVAV